MVKKAKAKSNSKKTVAAKKTVAVKAARRTATAPAKYEQPGAPWWKRVPGPRAKSL